MSVTIEENVYRNSLPMVETLTPTKSTVVTSGSVAVNARRVTMITSPDFEGTILTDTATASTTYIFEAAASCVLSVIAYTVTAGSIEIIRIA